MHDSRCGMWEEHLKSTSLRSRHVERYTGRYLKALPEHDGQRPCPVGVGEHLAGRLPVSECASQSREAASRRRRTYSAVARACSAAFAGVKWIPELRTKTSCGSSTLWARTVGPSGSHLWTHQTRPAGIPGLE